MSLIQTVKYNLEQLANDVKWLTHVPIKYYSEKRYDPDKIYVTFQKHNAKKAKKIDKIRLRIGDKVLEHMDWKLKDKILIANHPDDIMLFQLFKPDTHQGYTISKEGKMGRVSMRWVHDDVILEEMPYKKIDYVVYNDPITKKPKFIFFRVGEQKVEFGI